MLKKLVFRKNASLIADIVSMINPGLCVQDTAGAILLGRCEQPQTDNSRQPTLSRSPIVLQDETLGWVEGTSHTEVVAKLLSHLAYKEIEKRSLTQDLLEKYKEITLLFRTSEHIVDTLDVHEIAHLILKEAQQAFPSDEGTLMLLNETTDFLESIAAFKPNEDSASTLKKATLLGQGLIGNIVASGRGEIVNQVASDPRCQAVEQACSNLICVPLKIKDKLIGAIALSRLRSQPYLSENLKLLTTLASQAASVVSVLRHEKHLKESRQNDLIFQLSSQIRDSLDISEILQTAVSKIQTVLNLDRCFFLWHWPPTLFSDNVLTQTAPSGKRDNFGYIEVVCEAKNASLQELIGTYTEEHVGQRFLSRLRSQQTIQINDINQLSNEALSDFLKSCRSESLLALPLRTHKGDIGMLGCCSTQARNWCGDEADLLKAVTNQLVIALDQADLYERSCRATRLSQQKAHQLKQTLGTLKKIQAKLVQTEKMSSLGRMVAGVAHEINNPITFIHSNLEPLEQGVADLFSVLESYQQSYPAPTQYIQSALDDADIDFLKQDLPCILQSMSEGTDRIQGIVRSLRNFSRLDESDMKLVDLHAGIDSALLLLQHRFRADDTRDTPIALEKVYGDLPLVQCYPKQMNQVFLNLLANALDALEACSVDIPMVTITTTLQRTRENSRVAIRIADNGPGMSAQVQAKLFDPFFTTRDVGEG
ncbi:MAG: GAF domain-containing protein, partial [Cyanobacteria bacterium J06560_2]